MTIQATSNFDKVYDRIREESIWDDICMDIAEDSEGQTYIIIDSNSDANKLTKFVQETLELENDDFYLDEILGVEVVYSDEYCTCSDCYKVIRTSADSYSWQPDYFLGDGYIICNQCFNDNEDYQEAYIEEKINEPKTAINGLITEDHMRSMGFVKVNEESYENGYHRGQTDDPEEIYDELKNKYEEIVFYVDRTGQFDIHFSAWVRGEYGDE